MTTSTTGPAETKPRHTARGDEPARRSRRARITFGVVTALIVLLVTGITTETVLAARDVRRQPAPGELVELADGRTLHLDVTRRGSGGPTVVLEAGAGLPSSLWRPTIDAILEAVDGPVTVAAYDRAGTAWSGPPPTAPTPDVVVADLRDALGSYSERSYARPTRQGSVNGQTDAPPRPPPGSNHPRTSSRSVQGGSVGSGYEGPHPGGPPSLVADSWPIHRGSREP